VVAKKFRVVNRDQFALMPLDMRDWLPADHLVWFLIDVVDGMDLSGFRKRSRLGGTGRAPFDPSVLLLVLLYGYALGERSSRQLERLCGQDAAFRIITGNDCPDHTTIARFRQAHDEAFKDLFVQVLRLCAAEGLVRLGRISIDGTKIAANAAISANAGEDKIRAEVEKIVKEAAEKDAVEDDEFGDGRGDELPPSMRDRSGRRERIRESMQRLEEEQSKALVPLQAKASKAVELKARRLVLTRSRELKRYEQALATRAAAEAVGRKMPGLKPVPLERRSAVLTAKRELEAAQAKALAVSACPPALPDFRCNLTDPQSRLMRTRKGWVQGYNCQLAVSDDQIIISVSVVTEANDQHQFIPMMRSAQAAAEIVADVGPDSTKRNEIGVILADAGYYSDVNLTAAGPSRLIPAGKQNATDKAAAEAPAQGPPPEAATAKEAMAWNLRTEQGITDYKRRKVVVEPVNAHLKDGVGLRVMARRGIKAAQAELELAATVRNLLKVRNHRLA
jgi:transposase